MAGGWLNTLQVSLEPDGTTPIYEWPSTSNTGTICFATLIDSTRRGGLGGTGTPAFYPTRLLPHPHLTRT